LGDRELEDALENPLILAEVSWTRSAEEGDPDFRRLACNTLKKLEINASPHLSVTEFTSILQNFPSFRISLALWTHIMSRIYIVDIA
jgi:hypothetical protein